MSEPKIVVTGVEETNAALQQLGKNVVNDLQPAQQVAELGAAGARQRAPVMTGELASEYTVKDRYVVNDVSYATYIEYGTENIEAQYPIQQSLEASEPQAIDIYNEWIKQQIESVGFDATG